MTWLTEGMVPSYLKIDPAETVGLLKTDLRGFALVKLRETGKRQLGIVFGMSGGIDSAVICALLCRILGNQMVYPMMLPGPTSSAQSVDFAQAEIDRLLIPQDHCRLTAITDEDISHAAGREIRSGSVAYGNVAARLRMIRLRDFVVALQEEDPNTLYLLCGTENASEHWTGFFTIGGDASSDLELLASLFKTQVWQLAQYLRVDQRILDRDPAPELGDCATDEAALPAPYYKIDRVLYFLMKHGRNQADIIQFLQDHSADALVDLIFPLVGEKLTREETARILSWVKAKVFKLEIPYHITGGLLFA